MEKLIIAADADHKWREPHPDWPGKAAEGEPSMIYKRLLPRREGMPNVTRVRYDADHFEPPHSHGEDEVLYIVNGQMHVGTRMLGAGDAIYIARDTRYSVKAGDGGCEFVRFGLPT